MDRLAFWIRSQPFLLRLTWFTRILPAAGFIPTGLIKLLGRRFTEVSVETSVGAFFEAMFQTGLYRNFLGAAQVAAGVLLLIPRYTHLGAFLFVPIMLNIFVLTLAMRFGATSIVTGSMLLAVLYLCAWDYDRFRGLFTTHPLAPEHRPAHLSMDPLERAGFIAFATALICVFALTRGFLPVTLALPAMAIGLAAGLFTLVRFLTHGQRLTVP